MTDELATIEPTTPATSQIDEIELTEEALDQIRDSCKKSLFFLARAVLGFTDLDPTIHLPICEELQDPERTRVIIVMPRTWFKSTLGSIAYPIWRVINNPEIRILICQNSHNNAIKKLASIKQIFQKNKLFRLLFPDILPDGTSRWSGECLEVKRNGTHPEGTFEAAGTGTATTSRHYDLIVEDDTVSPEKDSMELEMQMPTAAEIEKAIGWHKLATPLLIHPLKSKIVIIGTRWCEEDLIGYVSENYKNYHVITRAVREKNGVPTSKEAGGLPAWPGRFNEAVLEEIEKTLGPYMFATLMMNLPTSAGNMVFKREWIRFYDSVNKNKLLIITSIDPAASDKESTGDPDYTSIVTTGVNPENGHIYVLDVVNQRLNPGETIDKLFWVYELYKPLTVLVESVAYQRTLKYWIEQKQRKLNTRFVVEDVPNARVSKIDRIRALQPFFADMMIHVRPFMDELQRQLLNFPAARGHDDVVDALSMHIKHWNDFLQRATQVKEEQLLATPFSGSSILAELEGRVKKTSSYPYDLGMFSDRLDDRGYVRSA
jgi:predicted phage terminase large subunit-like protein